MKKIYALSLLLILSSNNLFSQSGWYITHPFPNTRETLNDIYFINSTTGFLAIGEYRMPNSGYGRLYKTSNSGLNWDRVLFDSNTYFTKIYFIDDNTGFVFGSKLYKTTNAGATWLYKGTTNYKAISFINLLTGYACGLRDEYRAILGKTTNGGETWSNFYTNLTGYYLDMEDIHFKNEMTGIITGWHNTFAKTTNGGINWVYKLPPGIGIYWDTDIINDSICFITGNNQDSLFMKSTNYGENWSVLNTQFTGFGQIQSIEILNDLNGFAVGYNKIMRGSNSGNNWTELANPFNLVGSYSSFNRVYFNNTTGYILGDYGSLARSTNSGIDWKMFTRGDTLNAAHFISRKYGFAGGYAGLLLKTVDGGINWVDIPSGTINTITDIYFNDSLNGIFTGYNGLIGKTTNSGFNWVIQNINPLVMFKDMLFYGDTGLVVGTNGKIYKTTNFGNTWFAKNSNTTQLLKSVCLSSSNIFYVVGDSGIVLSSTNFGENWSANFVPTAKNLNWISFRNSVNGYIVADSGRIYKTTSSGLKWNLEFVYSSDNLNFISFLNETTGYIIGDRAITLKTTNGGRSWGTQSMGLHGNNSNNKIFSIDSSTSFIVGENRYIFKTSDGGGSINISIGVNTISNQIPQSFSLHQNYPNPFNPVTKIKFDVPNQSSTKIIIYDLLGREITTLVNEELKPGSYEVDWDGSGYASGVYFYSLVTDDIVETKRMVLVK